MPVLFYYPASTLLRRCDTAPETNTITKTLTLSNDFARTGRKRPKQH